MSQRLLCSSCGARYRSGCYELLGRSSIGEPAEWARVVRGRTARPTAAQRLLYVNGEPIQLSPEKYDCDLCGCALAPGTEAVCVTIWMPDRQVEPSQWETEFLVEQARNSRA